MPATPLWRGPLVWVTSTRHAPHRLDPLPLALASPDPLSERRGCDWGCAAVQALEREGRRYRIAYTSGSQVGTHAPVLAGLAVTVSAPSGCRRGCARAAGGRPAEAAGFRHHLEARLARQPVTDALAAHIEESWRLDAPQVRAA